MQRAKRGNPRRAPKRHQRQRPVSLLIAAPPREAAAERARLSLHECDPITGDEEQMSSLFYEHYRGYTIYSTLDGRCCIHGKQGGGCLRIAGLYVAFPDIEQAKCLIKHFQADGRTPWESMERFVPQQEYVCLNRKRQPNEQRQLVRLARA